MRGYLYTPKHKLLVPESMRGKSATRTHTVAQRLTWIGSIEELQERVIYLWWNLGGLSFQEIAEFETNQVYGRTGGGLIIQVPGFRRNTEDRWIHLMYGISPTCCPVRTYDEWIHRSGLRNVPFRTPPDLSAAFLNLKESWEYQPHMTPEVIQRHIEYAVTQAGVDIRELERERDEFWRDRHSKKL